MTYEAGPTGFGLARFSGRQVDVLGCSVLEKLQRPAGDRVKTDACEVLSPETSAASRSWAK